MFKKIDSKIKVIAVLNFVIGLIMALAGLVVLVVSDGKNIIGLALIILGFASFFASWILYGFGVLIEKVCGISERLTWMLENEETNSDSVAGFKTKEQKGYISKVMNPFEGASAMKIPKRTNGGKEDDN